MFESYKCNINANIDAISEQLTDKLVLFESQLSFEIYSLSRLVYPYLLTDVQNKHQSRVVEFYKDEKGEGYWLRHVYEYVCGVPSYLRNAELDIIYQSLINEFGEFKPKPAIHSSGGMVRSPVGVDIIISLSDTSILEVLKHYNSYHNNGYRDFLLGGRESIESDLEQAASINPIKFIPLVYQIKIGSLTQKYVHSIISGIAKHLHIRFGNLQDQNWKPVEPLPEGEDLAITLLSLVERYGTIGETQNEYPYAKAIQACTDVLNDDDTLKRIFFEFWKFGLSTSPDAKDVEQNDFVSTGINSVRGIIAESAVKVACELIEKEKLIPAELRDILLRFAKDEALAVKSSLLIRLPYLLSREPELGWNLIKTLVDGCASTGIYKMLEQSLYYQYYRNFELAEPYLNLMESAVDDETSTAWGRLASLSYLAGHIAEADLFNKLKSRKSDSTLIGVAQVLVINLTNAENRVKCIAGIQFLFEHSAPKEVYNELERALDDKEYLNRVPSSIIELYIINAPEDSLGDIDGIFSWFAGSTLYQPDQTLVLLELLISRFSTDQQCHFYRTEDLVVAIKMLLQHADLIDDDSFVHRVLCVQDWFLVKGVKEIESLLEAY